MYTAYKAISYREALVTTNKTAWHHNVEHHSEKIPYIRTSNPSHNTFILKNFNLDL
jgi:hypothetical protein